MYWKGCLIRRLRHLLILPCLLCSGVFVPQFWLFSQLQLALDGDRCEYQATPQTTWSPRILYFLCMKERLMIVLFCLVFPNLIYQENFSVYLVLVLGLKALAGYHFYRKSMIRRLDSRIMFLSSNLLLRSKAESVVHLFLGHLVCTTCLVFVKDFHSNSRQLLRS